MGCYLVVGNISLVRSVHFWSFFVVCWTTALTNPWWEGGGPFYASPPWQPPEPETLASIAALPTAATALGSRDSQVGRSLEWRHRGEGRTPLEGWVSWWSWWYFLMFIFEVLSWVVWFCLLSGVSDIGPLNEGGLLRLKRTTCHPNDPEPLKSEGQRYCPSVERGVLLG